MLDVWCCLRFRLGSQLGGQSLFSCQIRSSVFDEGAVGFAAVSGFVAGPVATSALLPFFVAHTYLYFVFSSADLTPSLRRGRMEHFVSCNRSSQGRTCTTGSAGFDGGNSLAFRETHLAVGESGSDWLSSSSERPPVITILYTLNRIFCIY